MKKVTGIGGVFFKSKDVAKIKEWYTQNLGFEITEWGSVMGWPGGQTAWNPFKETTDYFGPSTLPFMIDYRVRDVHALVADLRKDGVTVVGGVDDTDYGKFAWIMDPEGRKIELWEPVGETPETLPPAWTDKVVGLEAIYFKSDNPAKMKEWYKKHLDVGSAVAPLGEWAPVNNDDKLFSGTTKPYIFSYRVRDLKSLLSQLSTKDSWIIDPDGNKIILVQA